MWFCEDGTKIAFIKFNETLVEEYHLQYYMKDLGKSYPSDMALKYPKPGSPNPIVSFYISDLSDSSKPGYAHLVELEDPKLFTPEDTIITQVSWYTNESLLLRIMNRVQDHQKIYLVELDKGKWVGTLIRDEPTPDGSWYNWRSPLTVIKTHTEEATNPAYVEIRENEQGYAHLAYYKDASQVSPTFWLTKGEWEITSVSSFDSVRNIL